MAIETGNGRLVLLSGEPGVGKTHLAREVLVHAHERRKLSFVGPCFDQHTSVPFFPFTEALSNAFAAVPRELRIEALHRWPELVHVIPDVDSVSGASKVDGQNAQLGAFLAVTGFLQSLTEASPLVLLLEDLHWADATSPSLLLYICRHLQRARMLVLGTYRVVDSIPGVWDVSTGA